MMSQNQFCLLVQFSPRGARLNYEGLKIIEYYDFVSIVTLEGVFENHSLKSSLINSKTRTQIKGSNEGVWISKYPKYHPHINKYIILLRIISQNEQSLAAAHSFCALISNFMVFIWSDSLNMKFLTSLRQKMKAIKNNKEEQKVAALCTIPKRNPSDSQTFDQALGRQSIQKKYIDRYHPKIFEFDELTKNDVDQILKSGGNMLSTISKICPPVEKQVLTKNYGNRQLVHGPAIKSFIENMIEIYSQTGQFDVELAEQQIQVEEQFEEYMLGIQKFNAKCKSRLGNEPIGDVKAMIADIRQEAQNQKFYTNSPYYAQKMTVYMDRKQDQLTRLNQELLDLKNLNLLQSISGQTMRKVKKQKNVTPEQVNNQLDRLIIKYNNQATPTANKDKLLTQFMQVFRPTLYEESNVDYNLKKQTLDVEQSNLKLQRQIAELEQKYKKKKGKQNKCCIIM